MSVESVMPSNHLILCCPLLLLPSIFPSIRVFSVTQLCTSGGQSIGSSVSASVVPVNIQGWLPLRWTGLISLLCILITYKTFVDPEHEGLRFAFLAHYTRQSGLLYLEAIVYAFLSVSLTIKNKFSASFWSITLRLWDAFCIYMMGGEGCLGIGPDYPHAREHPLLVS